MILGSDELITALNGIDLKAVSEELAIGELTLKDIIDALVRPERDPRDDLPRPLLKKDVLKIRRFKCRNGASRYGSKCCGLWCIC